MEIAQILILLPHNVLCSNHVVKCVSNHVTGRKNERFYASIFVMKYSGLNFNYPLLQNGMQLTFKDMNITTVVNEQQWRAKLKKNKQDLGEYRARTASWLLNWIVFITDIVLTTQLECIWSRVTQSKMQVCS